MRTFSIRNFIHQTSAGPSLDAEEGPPATGHLVTPTTDQSPSPSEDYHGRTGTPPSYQSVLRAEEAQYENSVMGTINASLATGSSPFNIGSQTSSVYSADSPRSSPAPHKIASQGDVAKLIKEAGSPEAVIRNLLKEKQRNTQLWRLFGEQRAMLRALNKNFGRALEDKEKYRKKLEALGVDPDECAESDDAESKREDTGEDPEH